MPYLVELRKLQDVGYGTKRTSGNARTCLPHVRDQQSPTRLLIVSIVLSAAPQDGIGHH